MSKYSNSRFDTFYYDAKADVNEPCEVIIGEAELTVSYYDEDIQAHAVYKGKETSPGHFELVASMVNGRATLHRFPEADLLVGGWNEDGEKGMWRIELR